MNGVASSLARRVLLRKQMKSGPIGEHVDEVRKELSARFEGRVNVRDAVMQLAEELQIARALLGPYRLAFGEPSVTPGARPAGAASMERAT